MNLVRGLVLMAIALVFGLGSLNYSIGQFSRAGPGLFPLMVSCLLFLIGLISVVPSRFVAVVPLSYNMKNIALVLLGLCGFALLSQHLNMIYRRFTSVAIFDDRKFARRATKQCWKPQSRCWFNQRQFKTELGLSRRGWGRRRALRVLRTF